MTGWSRSWWLPSSPGRSRSRPIRSSCASPQDGFSEYHAFPPFRPRWGDYGAAAVDGDSVWIASEYMGQTCAFAELVATGFSCGGTRTILANWATRVSRIVP